MTPLEIELNIKLLNTQRRLVRIEARLEKVEAVLDAMCIKKRYKLLRFLSDFLPSRIARRNK